MARKKRSYKIKYANGDFNVYLYYGWKVWHLHTVDSYESASSIGRQWRKSTPKETN